MIELIRIRSAVTKDIPRILELYDELTITTSYLESAKNPSLEEYQKTLDVINSIPGYDLLVAEDQDGILGSVVLLIMPNLAHRASPWALVENLIIDSKQQRQNIGKKLMEYAINRARDKGCYKLILNSNKIRKGAHKFYQSLGFELSSYGFSIYF
jgi:GNAT superfamily N-acetyltransferase